MTTNPLLRFLQQNPVRKTAIEARVSTATVARLIDPTPESRPEEWLSEENMAKWSQRKLRGFIKSIVKLCIYASIPPEVALPCYPLPYDSETLSGIIKTTLKEAAETDQPYKSHFDRIVQTREIRAAYISYAPGFMVDRQTNTFSGIFYEALEVAAQSLGLQVQWTHEVNWHELENSIQINQCDVIASGILATAIRAKYAEFTIPLYYSALDIFVRSDDQRFENNLERINAPDVRIAALEGEVVKMVADNNFPNAAQVILPTHAAIPDMLTAVAENRADIVIAEGQTVYAWSSKTGMTLKNITLERGVRVLPTTIMLPKGEHNLRSMLNTALEEQLYTGQIHRLMKKYSTKHTRLFPPRQPYDLR